jgi:hypothetical protein
MAPNQDDTENEARTHDSQSRGTVPATIAHFRRASQPLSLLMPLRIPRQLLLGEALSSAVRSTDVEVEEVVATSSRERE